MPKTWIVARNELYRYFISPLAYVYLIAFCSLTAPSPFISATFSTAGRLT